MTPSSRRGQRQLYEVVSSLDLGTATIRGPEVFWMSDWDRMYRLQFQSVLVRGRGVNALVNTSPPDDLAAVSAEFPDLDWPRVGTPGGLTRRPAQMLDRALADAGLLPGDVTHVILTPLELYTTGTLPRFVNAEIFISKRGWIHFHTTHAHPHDRRWRSMTRETLSYLVIDAWDRVHLLEDEDEVHPGLRTWWSGVHHRASMVVEIDTPGGVVAVSDSFFYYENVEEGRLLGLSENMYEAEAVSRRVLGTAAHIVPLHDPKVFERYPGGRIVE